MSKLFNECSSLESITFSNFDTQSVIDMSFLFAECASLKSVDLSKFNTKKVTNFNSLFQGCSSLKALKLSNFDTSLVTNMGSMFNGCENLNLLDISNFNMEKVDDASNMFSGLKELIYIDLSNIQNYDNSKFQEELTAENGLNTRLGIFICQTNDIVINENAKFIYCYFDFENRICTSSNYISVYYKEKITYTNGFQYNSQKKRN